VSPQLPVESWPLNQKVYWPRWRTVELGVHLLDASMVSGQPMFSSNHDFHSAAVTQNKVRPLVRSARTPATAR